MWRGYVVPSVVGDAGQLIPAGFLISPFRPWAQEPSEELGNDTQCPAWLGSWPLVSQSEYLRYMSSVWLFQSSQ